MTMVLWSLSGLALVLALVALYAGHRQSATQRLAARSALEELRDEQRRLRQHMLRLGEHTLRLERRLNRVAEQAQWGLGSVDEEAPPPAQLRPLLDDMEGSEEGISETERTLRALLAEGGGSGER